MTVNRYCHIILEIYTILQALIVTPPPPKKKGGKNWKTDLVYAGYCHPKSPALPHWPERRGGIEYSFIVAEYVLCTLSLYLILRVNPIFSGLVTTLYRGIYVV